MKFCDRPSNEIVSLNTSRIKYDAKQDPSEY